MTSSGTDIRVVSQVPRPAWPRRAARSLVVLVGYAIVTVGVVAAIPALILLVAVPFATFNGDGSVEAWLALAGFAAAAVILLWLGLRIARGRRRLVVFLRRFGFNDATEALTYAVGGSLGRRWRLVTLDDTLVEAVGVSRGARIGWALGRWLLVAGLLLAIVLVVRWFLGGGVDEIFDGIVDPIVDDAVADAANPLEAIGNAFVAALVGALVAGLVAAFIAGLMVVGLVSLGVVNVAVWSVQRAVRRAEGGKALHLDEAGAIEGTVGEIVGGARRIQAPRLVVVKVNDAIWRDVVGELCEEADAAVVDISDPTDHLVWEVDLLRSTVRARMVLIGRRDRVEALARGEDDTPAARALRERLAGERVLVYEDAEDERVLRRFARNLSATLEGVG